MWLLFNLDSLLSEAIFQAFITPHTHHIQQECISLLFWFNLDITHLEISPLAILLKGHQSLGHIHLFFGRGYEGAPNAQFYFLILIHLNYQKFSWEFKLPNLHQHIFNNTPRKDYGSIS